MEVEDLLGRDVGALRDQSDHRQVLVGRALLDEACALARDICSCVPGVMEQVKSMIDTGYSMHFDEAMRYELAVGIESSKQIDSAEIGRRREAVMERGRKQ